LNTTALDNWLRDGGEVSLMHLPHLTLPFPQKIPDTSVGGLVNPAPIVWPEGLGQLKIKLSHQESILQPSGL
jgi:hypothetical protein